MFPYRSLFRLLVTLSLVSLSVVLALLAVVSLFTTPTINTADYFEGRVFYGAAMMGDECYYADDVESFRSRILKEFEYKERLEQLTPAEITNLTALVHRDITIQWSKRELLPPPKPLYHIKCLDYLDIDYNVLVSIVIPYHDELAILLLRTLTTILHRTLPKYLKEIVLIDDYSKVNITEEVLQYGAEQHMPLVMLHNEEQLGIANSRLKGIEAASGDVVVILDSHMEVGEVWLEPLLSMITSYPKSIAVPCINMISERDYDTTTDMKLCTPFIVQIQKAFGIIAMTDFRDQEDRAKWEPYPSSGMLGGALAAYRSTLLEYYPEGLLSNNWSIENNRLSLRAWLCGEGVWVSTCSQVQHANGNDEFLQRYDTHSLDEHGSLFDVLISESISEILNFIVHDDTKTSLISKYTDDEDYAKFIQDNADDIRSSFDPDQHGCKDYEYYTTEVYQEYMSWESDQFEAVGEVQSRADPQMCLEVLNYVVAPYPCRGKPANIFNTHTVGFTKNHCVRCGDVDYHCWDTNSYDEKSIIKLYGCHLRSATEGEPYDSQRFDYNKTTQQIVHGPSERCLEYIDATTAWLMKCNAESVNQKWNIKMSAWF